MSQSLIGPPKRKFNQLFTLAEAELANLRNKTIPASLLVAICINATQDRPFFCCGPKPYREAMAPLLNVPGFNPKEFLLKMVPKTGWRKDQVPRFEFVRQNWACSEYSKWRCQGNETDGVIMACNWGIAQVPGYDISRMVEPEYKIEYLKAFVGDVNMQMRDLIRIIHVMQMAFNWNLHTCVNQFHINRGYGDRKSDVVARDMDLAYDLAAIYEPDACACLIEYPF